MFLMYCKLSEPFENQIFMSKQKRGITKLSWGWGLKSFHLGQL